MTNGRAGPTLLVVVAVLIGGCSGLAAPDPTVVTVTPAPVPTDTTTPIERSSTERVQPARQLTDTGTVDLVFLAWTHYRTVFGTSYTYSEIHQVTARNGSVLTQTVVEAAYNNSTQRIVVTRSSPPASRHEVTEYYVTDDEPIAARSQRGNRTDHHQLSYERFYQRMETLPGREPLISHLVVGTRNTVDPRLRTLRELNDTGRFYLFASRLERPDRFHTIEAVDEPRNLSLLVDIDQRGFIRSYRLSYSAKIDGVPVRITRRVRYSSVGTTIVSRPDWYGRTVANDTSARPTLVE